MKNKDIPSKLGKHIISLREEKGLTAEKLAAYSELSKTGLRNVELYAKDPKLSTLIKIADGLNIPLKQLFDF